MARDIKLKVAGKEHVLSPDTPELEGMMRIAAEQVNAILSGFDRRFPDTRLEDKLAFVAIQLGVGKLCAEKELETLKADIRSMEEQLASYLDGCSKP